MNRQPPKALEGALFHGVRQIWLAYGKPCPAWFSLERMIKTTEDTRLEAVEAVIKMLEET